MGRSEEWTHNFCLPKLYALRWITSDFRAYWFYIHTWMDIYSVLLYHWTSLYIWIFLGWIIPVQQCLVALTILHLLRRKRKQYRCIHPFAPVRKARTAQEEREQLWFEASQDTWLWNRRHCFCDYKTNKQDYGGNFWSFRSFRNQTKLVHLPFVSCLVLKGLWTKQAKKKHWEPKPLPPPVFLNTEVTLHSLAASQIQF